MSLVIPSSTIATPQQKDNWQKGREFEEYVIRLFNKRNFNTLKHHKAEKYYSDLPADHSNPDLEMELILRRGRNFKFALECKWRNGFYNGVLPWATSEQIYRYRKFQHERRIPVFIAIGLGGEPGDPEHLFVTPLDHIADFPDLYESRLIRYSRRPSEPFYLDIRQGKLF